MGITNRNSGPVRLLSGVLLAILAYMALFSILRYSPSEVFAHSGDIFGPACGAASLDGNVNAVEWSSASTQTFQMYSAGGADPFTATLHVMNGGHYLYLGITINDDEFSTIGTWLPQGDGFRIDFDNRPYSQLASAPLCSGDTLDFCLHAGDVVGFRLEYLEAEADGSFGGSQLYPGSGATSEADIVIGTCSIPDWFIYLPVIQKSAT